jgi:hypothetical protein
VTVAGFSGEDPLRGKNATLAERRYRFSEFVFVADEHAVADDIVA